ncbi:DUF938 domain-containing protein [Aquincola tertiaricarbonis]|uniref:DUF938 domain-containing protein n=1 Tax=Aquincola tertiaricarbonis TaxID=391953 RepID=UPI0006150457|nr:DUF938 domain-containing protein [Aquincola tertiaricarbonis]
MSTDHRPFSPASERNRGPILDVLLQLLPPQGTALEIACGTGQHAAHFAPALPGWQWWPSDPQAEALQSTAAWCEGIGNVQPPLQLDVMSPDWTGVPSEVDLVFCANMIHISPWATTRALMQGTARHLRAGGLLLTYGPYFVQGEPPSPGNLAFDADLKQRNAAWGIRWLHEVQAEAAAAGLQLQRRFDMPANNLALAWGRPAT